ncbi:MarR family winged helix-turn-helix transcriptional regulator [Aquibium carbonis]|uniref:MarR family winged helix-turn-helix transcriptional regulator n=1 Tax=Aquibium carbonis TaxID=2495581 RepID=UPI00147965A9|nr:MarR family transcriptional regulator [Aquibium carbonis]
MNDETESAVAQRLDQGILHGLLGRQLRVTYLAVFRTIEEQLTGLGITPQQFGLLVIVDRNPGARQTLIAKARGLDKSTLVPMIDRLERDNLLERRPLATDRRIRAIWITERGREVLRKAVPIVQKGDDLLRAHLSEGELAELIRLMEKVREGLGVTD